LSEERKERDNEDKALIAQFLTGDDSAFEALVRKYRNRVISIALRVVRDQDEALDISQEAFIKAYRSLKGFAGKSSFYTWLYRIVTNLAIDHRRRNKRVVEFRDELEPGQENEESELTANEIDPRQEALDKELETRIYREIDDLPEYHRAVILLRDVEGLSYNEIADTLDCSVGTVMSRLHYAREKLQASLEGYL